MPSARFDVLVIGGGPAGSIASLVLARGGARVALVDKSTFPRDKACGDLVGPRGLQVLTDLGLELPVGPELGDMLVVGPTGRRARLPSAEGLSYPGHAVAVTREAFDAYLHRVALDAGVTELVGRAEEPLGENGSLDGYRLSTGEQVRADFVIGADGATSRVAAAAGMLQAHKVLWGFAVRSYIIQPVDLPTIALWEPSPWRAFPGYGWLFPGPEGIANVGIGVGTLSDRQAGAKAVRALPDFVEHLSSLGLVGSPGALPAKKLGGWLKMGMVGTTPAAGRVLLVGDAAGLVNPLQGEGISQAMTSARAAAESIFSEPANAAQRYRARLRADHLPYVQIAAALQSALLLRPRSVAVTARLLTTFGGLNALAGGWAVFWNELLDGAPPSTHRKVAAAAMKVGGALTSSTATARWFGETLPS